MKKLDKALATVSAINERLGPEEVARIRALPKDDPEVAEPFDCATCQDAGFVVRRREPSGPLTGRAVPCPDCRSQSITLQEFLERSLIPAGFHSYRVATYPGAPALREQAERYVATCGEGTSILLMTGPVGTGKSVMAASIMRELFHQRGWLGQYWTVTDLLNRYRHASRTDRAEDELDPSEIDYVMQIVPVLVLDELGPGLHTEFAYTKTLELIDHRWSNDKPTIVTTNHPLSELDPRIRSRLADQAKGMRMKFDGEIDLRTGVAG